MSKTLRNLWVISLLCAILVAVLVIKKSLFLRWFGYETIPIPITDEFDYVWQGLSLRKHGVPMAWTTLSGNYADQKWQPKLGTLDGFGINFEGKLVDLNLFKLDHRPLVTIAQIDYMKGMEHMYFVAPFFDHPPLGGLIYSLGIDNQVSKLDEVKPAGFRQPALILAIVSAALVFVLLYLVSANPWVGTLGVIIYSTVPTYLLATRMAFLENVVATIILTHLVLLIWLTRSTNKDPNNRIGYLLAMAAGLAGGISVLAKESAAGFLVGSVILLVINKIPKKIIYVFLTSLAIPVVGYFAWGLWMHAGLFWNIFAENSSRGYFGALKLVAMLEALKFRDFPTDGWWIWGLLSFLVISLNGKNKNILFITLPLFTHLLLILLLGSNNSPWYFIACIPFFAACSAIFIGQIFTNPTIGSAMAFFLIPFSSSYYWGRVALNLAPSINHYRYSILIFGTFLALRLVFKNQKFSHILWMVFLAVLINKIVVFNEVFFPYLIANWGSLPIPSLPNF